MLKALIIDDEVDICYLLSGILRNKNVQTDYANSIHEALHVLEKHSPEIIFLDNHLPDGTGMDFIDHIKKNHPAAKVVMITAFDTAAYRSRALSEGADFFIAKPFSRDTIHQAIDLLAS